MNITIVAIKDNAAGYFLNLTTVRAKGEAMRNFADIINDPNKGLHAHAEDFELWALGESQRPGRHHHQRTRTPGPRPGRQTHMKKAYDLVVLTICVVGIAAYLALLTKALLTGSN